MRIIGILVVIILALMVGFYAYMGGFKSIETTDGAFGPAEIVYATHLGPYEQLGKSWGVFKTEWEEAGLAECDALGVYFDPPDTPKDKLRTVIGCRIDALPEDQKAALKEKLDSFVLPESPTLVSTFPFKNVASYFLAPAKVYPAMMKKLPEGATPPVAIEVYGPFSTPSPEITFILPLGVERTAYQPLLEAF